MICLIPTRMMAWPPPGMAPMHQPIIPKRGLLLLQTARGDLDSALEAYRRALALDSNDLDAIQGMIDVYTAQGDYWNIAEMYERAFAVVPEIRSQKKIMKIYKKACKKANRPVTTI